MAKHFDELTREEFLMIRDMIIATVGGTAEVVESRGLCAGCFYSLVSQITQDMAKDHAGTGVVEQAEEGEHGAH